MSTSAARMRRMRERRREGLLPGADAPARDPDELLLPAVEATLAALSLSDADRGIAEVARSYARLIDQAANQAYALRWYGPLLHRALEELHASPMSRSRRRL